MNRKNVSTVLKSLQQFYFSTGYDLNILKQYLHHLHCHELIARHLVF